jgi:HEAT repeat protein
VLSVPGVCDAQYSFEHVAGGLEASDAATRIRAIRILRDAGRPEAAAPIAALLEDADDRVQVEAIDAERALFTAKPPAAMPFALLPQQVPIEVLRGLVAAMRDDTPRIRIEALNVFGLLAPLGGPDAGVAIRSGISWTIEVLRRGDSDAQLAAAAAAGRVQENCGLVPRDRPTGQTCAELGNVLVDAINGPNPQVRRAAMRALGGLRYLAAAQALADQFSYYERGSDAEAALEGLARIGDPAYSGVFRRQLANPIVTIRRLAIEGLARSEDQEEVAELERVGETERSNSVLLALHFAAVQMHARGKSSAPAKVDTLVAALQDSSLRPLALQYLVELSPSIAPALAGFLHWAFRVTPALCPRWRLQRRTPTPLRRKPPNEP